MTSRKDNKDWTNKDSESDKQISKMKNIVLKQINKYALSILFLLTLLFISGNAMAQHRKKVALVLSGGGAKGTAYIGALKVIEEVGIPIDYVVGTSMGAIVGGLYSVGYTTAQLDSMVRTQDWEMLLSDKIERKKQTLTERENSEKYILSIPFSKKEKQIMDSGIVRGENLDDLFSELIPEYNDSIDFNKLPIPFACVAVNLVDGKEVVLRNGRLAESIRASMAIPGVFTPVKKREMVLVDGGLLNNYPADVAKAMGADIILGISVQKDLRNEHKLKNVMDVISQVTDVACRNKYENNKLLTDLFIKIDTEGYGSTSFSSAAIDTLIYRGEKTARENWAQLYDLKKKIGVEKSFIPQQRIPFAHSSTNNTIFVSRIILPKSDKRYVNKVFKQCNIREYTEISIGKIENAIDKLREKLPGVEFGYKLKPSHDGQVLEVRSDKKEIDNIKLGVRFDSEEIAALLVNAQMQLNTFVPSSISLTGRLGKRYLAQLDYVIEPTLKKRFNLSYAYRYNDLNIYQKGQRAYNVTYHQHTSKVCFSDEWLRNLRYEVGMSFEYYHNKNLLTLNPDNNRNLRAEHFLNYFFNLKYSSLDNSYFPMRGMAFQADYTLHTDNFYQYDNHAPFSDVVASWTVALPLKTERLVVMPSIYGRVLIGNHISDVYANVLGGEIIGRYMPQQLPFVGISNIELVEKSILASNCKLRYKIFGEHYISLSGNIALTDNKLQDVLGGELIYGIGIGYGFNSKLGPLEATVGYSGYTDKINCFANLGFYF